MNCLLCDTEMRVRLTWRTLLFNDIEPVICDRCTGKFEPVTGPVCPLCSAAGEGLCADCRYWEATPYAGLIESGSSLFRYNEAMKAYLHQFKFLQDVELARVCAADIHDRLKGQTLVPIPMNEKKLKGRTFSQVDELLKEARLPSVHLLTKTEDVQGKKTKEERRNTSPLFGWNGEPVPKKLVIVDDLYTTGTTMRHAAKALKEAGAEQISIFSVIRS